MSQNAQKIQLPNNMSSNKYVSIVFPTTIPHLYFILRLELNRRIAYFGKDMNKKSGKS